MGNILGKYPATILQSYLDGEAGSILETNQFWLVHIGKMPSVELKLIAAFIIQRDNGLYAGQKNGTLI